MKLLLVLPLLIPLLTAAGGLVAWRAPRVQRWLGVGGAALLLAAGVVLLADVAAHGVQAVQIGRWAAPFGITLVADLFSAVLVVLAGLIGLAVAVYSVGDIDGRRQRFGYYPLLQILLMGVCGAFLTGDLFNLYVWFEVLLMASFVLLALGGERAQMEGAIKYVTLNLMSSAIFLAGVGIVYGVANTLNMAHLSLVLREVAVQAPELVVALALLFLLAFGIKSAIFPLFFWLPASYATPPAAVSALFAALLTKVGVYSLVRVFTLVFPPVPAPHGLFWVILVLACLTMLTGVAGAVAQMEFRRILSFHSISQIGYMVLGLGLLLAPTPAARTLALAAALIYMVHHSIVKGNLFLISGVARRLGGTYELKPLGGLSGSAPWLAGLFLVSALSLAGLPPLSGFWAKLAVVRAGVDGVQYVAVAAALFTGLLTLLSMVKIWNEAFWKPAPAPLSGRLPRGWRRVALYAPIVLLAGLTVGLGVWPQPLIALAERAGAQVLDTQAYIDAVGAALPAPVGPVEAGVAAWVGAEEGSCTPS